MIRYLLLFICISWLTQCTEEDAVFANGRRSFSHGALLQLSQAELRRRSRAPQAPWTIQEDEEAQRLLPHNTSAMIRDLKRALNNINRALSQLEDEESSGWCARSWRWIVEHKRRVACDAIKLTAVGVACYFAGTILSDTQQGCAKMLDICTKCDGAVDHVYNFAKEHYEHMCPVFAKWYQDACEGHL